MADRKYYVLCEQNCRFEGMTKEQILTAITQAVENGTVGDIDIGFVTTIKTINGKPLRFFVGTQSEYESLSKEQKDGVFALITNDTQKEDIEKILDDLVKYKSGLEDGSSVPLKARTAELLTFDAPQTNTKNALSAKGYYLAYAYYAYGAGQILNFGVFYWDGETMTGVQGYGAYSLSVNYDGAIKINMKTDSGYEDITANCDVEIKKIGNA